MTTLLVASTGGHLAELHDLAPRLGVQDDCVWVTFDSPQSRSLLDGQEVIHVPPATTRDAVGALRDLVAARRVLRGGRFTQVISTGASVAMSFILPAALRGLACHYIESATRTEGPSLTGRLVARVPFTRLYTQYPGWADGRWRYGGSIFDGYRATPAPAARPVSRIVVAVGTHETFGFPGCWTGWSTSCRRRQRCSGRSVRPGSPGCPPAPAGRCRSRRCSRPCGRPTWW